MAAIYAYFDESGKQRDHPVVSFSGVCASESGIHGFHAAWQILLRSYGLDVLHMAAASRLKESCGTLLLKNQSYEERVRLLIPFADCINEHLELGLVQAWDIGGFNKLGKNVRAALGNPTDPYYVAFHLAMKELDSFTRSGDKISLICDDDEETAPTCYQHYRAIRRHYESLKRKVESISFACDSTYYGLQAADMVAFLARREARKVFYKEENPFSGLYNRLTARTEGSQMLWKAMLADEALLAKIARMEGACAN